MARRDQLAIIGDLSRRVEHWEIIGEIARGIQVLADDYKEMAIERSWRTTPGLRGLELLTRNNGAARFPRSR